MLGDNDEDVIEDVSEDEWLQKSLRLVGIKKKHAVKNDNVRRQSSKNESMNVEDDKDDGSNSDDGFTIDDDSDSQDNDFLVDPDNMIDDVDVDMAEFRSNIDANVEWVGSKAIVTMEEKEFKEEGVNHDELDSGSDSEYEGERKKSLKMYHKMKKANASNAESGGTTWKENFYVGLKISNSKEIKKIVTRVAIEQRRELPLKKNDKVRVRCICRGKVPQFGREDGDDDSGSKGVVSSGLKGNGQSKEKGQKVISKSDGPLTPNATKVFNIIMKEAGQMKKLIVIPCKHALAAIWDMAGNGEETAIPESYYHQVHWLSAWKDMYIHATQKRKKSAAEGTVRGNKLSKAGKSITCGKCKGIGHNKRKCPNDASG
uniref:Transposase, mutator type n=1 Tax=Tanacetum cinerariifolium TaxID=118510 RepID=A0A699JMX0_TANCI|nr:transposase, mutator type [Tanacetum cinerariifolium]